MTWREQLRPASFRSVSFFVASHEATSGRKTVPHEYPFRDDVYVEDLGRRGRRYSVSGYVIGLDYFTARDDLIEALEGSGPGTLVHPYIGNKQVSCDEFSYSEDVTEGGLVRFSMVFRETGEKPLEPRSRIDAPSAVLSSVESATSRVRTAFQTAYNITSQPQFALDSLAGLLGEQGNMLRDTISPVLTTASDLAALSRSVDSFIASAADLVRNPLSLVASVADLFDSVRGLGGNRIATDAFVSAARFVPATDPPAATTPIRVQEASNQVAINSLFRQSAVLEAARRAPVALYDSYEDAVTTRQSIVTILDAEAQTAPDDVFQALYDTRAQVIKALPPTDHELSRLITVTPPVTVPSIVLAYDFYEDSDRETDIVRRNNIRHPGFVPGGKKLQVLSRAQD